MTGDEVSGEGGDGMDAVERVDGSPVIAFRLGRAVLGDVDVAFAARGFRSRSEGMRVVVLEWLAAGGHGVLEAPEADAV